MKRKLKKCLIADGQVYERKKWISANHANKMVVVLFSFYSENLPIKEAAICLLEVEKIALKKGYKDIRLQRHQTDCGTVVCLPDGKSMNFSMPEVCVIGYRNFSKEEKAEQKTKEEKARLAEIAWRDDVCNKMGFYPGHGKDKRIVLVGGERLESGKVKRL